MDAGTSPDDLAAVLDAQRMTSLTEPVPVSLAGHEGLYVELTASKRIRPSTCTGDVFEVWSSGADGRWLLFEPGQVDRLWLMEVGGRTVVLDARSVPGVTQRAERRPHKDRGVGPLRRPGLSPTPGCLEIRSGWVSHQVTDGPH